MLRIPITLHRDLRGRTVHFAQVVGCEFDFERSNVLVEARQLGRARDRNNPRPLREQPSERDLSRCRPFLLGDPAEQVDNSLIRLPIGESWYGSGTTTEWEFTSYERDSESGNDYALGREYENRLARFSAVDTTVTQAADPQQWNGYVYVAGDPINRVDPSGHTLEPIGCGEIYGCDCVVLPAKTGHLS